MPPELFCHPVELPVWFKEPQNLTLKQQVQLVDAVINECLDDKKYAINSKN